MPADAGKNHGSCRISRAKGDVEVRITVMGAGNGALAVAGEWSLAGHDVRMVQTEEHSSGLAGIPEAGAVTVEGEIAGVAPITYVGTDFERALDGADVVFAVGPAFATETFAEASAPYLTDGMTVVVCPGSCLGAMAFARTAGLSLDGGVTVAETSTLPYAARILSPATVRVFHRLNGGLYVAALGQERTAAVAEMLGTIWETIEPAGSVWQTALQNGNPVIHPAVTLLNASLIDRTQGDFLFYEEGVTEASGRLMEAVDRERLAIGEALGVRVLSEPDLGVLQEYMTEANYTTGYSTAPGFLGIGAQDTLDNRYLTEDVGVTMVFFADVARAVGVPTPVMDSIITITEVVLATDLRSAPYRSLASLGLAGRTAEELASL